MRISVIVSTLFSGWIVVLWEDSIHETQNNVLEVWGDFFQRAKSRISWFQIHVPTTYQGGEGIKICAGHTKINERKLHLEICETPWKYHHGKNYGILSLWKSGNPVYKFAIKVMLQIIPQLRDDLIQNARNHYITTLCNMYNVTVHLQYDLFIFRLRAARHRVSLHY